MISPGDSEAFVLRNRLAHTEGTYTNSAFYRLTGSARAQIIIESRYSVVKRMRVSPGAIVFWRDAKDRTFRGEALVAFRRESKGGGGVHSLDIEDVPVLFEHSVNRQTQMVEKRMCKNCDAYLEDTWSVSFQSPAIERTDQVMQLHGELDFVVRNEIGDVVTRRSLPYNAEGVVSELKMTLPSDDVLPSDRVAGSEHSH